MTYATINPYSGETLKTFRDATDADVTEAIGKAHNAFLAWRETSFSERAKILQKAADLLQVERLPGNKSAGLTETPLETAEAALAQSFDARMGGFGKL